MTDIPTVRQKVAEQIAGLSPRLEKEIVDVLVEREAKKRSEALVKVYDQLVALERDIKKYGPDVAHYDADGKKVAEHFSKKQLQERDKHMAQMRKRVGAINKALDKGEFSDVYNFASGKDPSEGKPGTGEDADSEAS